MTERLFSGIAWHRRQRARLAKIAHPQLRGSEQDDVAIIEHRVHAVTVARWVMADVVEWQPRRARGRRHARVRTARTAPMVPHDDALGGLRDKRIPPGHRTAVAVVHGETALPLWLDGTLEHVRRAEVTVHQAE